MGNWLDAIYVKDALRRLARAKADVFGADVHQFQLNPTLSERELSAFENLYQIRLPQDYRHFLSHIGNGGAGPAYGVFPLGYTDGLGSDLELWSEGEGLVGVLSEPFVHSEPSNDTSGMPEWGSDENTQDAYDEAMDKFEKRYWSSALMNGAFPICHEGCALRIWLVVAGKEAANLWHDRRADYRGLSPVTLKDGSRATFSSWYSEWLEDCLMLL